MELFFGILLACAASSLYDLAIALQAKQARTVSSEYSLKPSLLGRLVRNRRWLLATAISICGWPLQIFALTMAPLTVVQPCLAFGLLLLLFFGHRMLQERVGVREIGAVLVIALGVTAISIGSPEHTSSHADAAALAIGLGAISLLALSPYIAPKLMRRVSILIALAAGAGFALNGVIDKLIADSLENSEMFAAFAWLAATATAAILALLTEMSALQRLQVTTVAPLVFSVQVGAPVLLAPLIAGESWASTTSGGILIVIGLALVIAGAFTLTRSPAVSGLIAAAEPGADASAQEGAERNPAEPAAVQLGGDSL